MGSGPRTHTAHSYHGGLAALAPLCPRWSGALGLEPHPREDAQLTCLCPADDSISPVLTFVLQTEPACHPVYSVWGECHASSLHGCEAITEGRVVSVKMGDLEPAGHFIDENLGEFLSISHPQLTAGQCEKLQALWAPAPRAGRSGQAGGCCLLTVRIWFGARTTLWSLGTPALFQDHVGHYHW